MKAVTYIALVKRTIVWVVLLCCVAVAVVALQASFKARPIPSSVSPDEYAVYAAWLTLHVQNQENRYQKNPPEELLVFNRTFPMRYMEPERCDRLPKQLVQPLLAPGEAEYRLRNERPNKAIVVPFSYRLVDGEPQQPTRSYEIIRVTRVAFSRDGIEGLFAVQFWACRTAPPSSRFPASHLECGDGEGYYVNVKKENSHWRIERAPVRQHFLT